MSFGTIAVDLSNVQTFCSVIFPKSTVLSGTPSEWDTTYRVNVLGVVNTLQALVPAMLGHPEPGLVVVTGSVAGVMPGGYGR